MRRPVLASIALSTLVAATALVAVPMSPASAAAPAVWVHNASDRLFAGTPAPDDPPTEAVLHAARGEQEAVQIAVRSDAELSDVQLQAGALTGPDGAQVPANAISVRKEYLHQNVSLVEGDNELPPEGGNDYYDSLEEDAPTTIPANRTQPYFFAVRVPRGQAAGNYTGEVVVRSDAGDVTVPVRLRVYDVTLPTVQNSKLRVNNWTTSAGWDYTGTEAAIPLQYGVEMYDENWWRVIENMAANHARHRNNVVFADFQALLIPNTTVDAQGNLSFGWETFDRFVQTYADAGAMRYLYTPHLLEKDGANTNVEILQPDGNGGVARVLAGWDSAEANAYLDQMIPALKEHLDAKGWTDKFYMSALDEPNADDHVNAAKWLYAKFRPSFPNLLTNEAHNHQTTGLEEDLTTFTPVINIYEENVGYYQNQRLAGKDLWLYNCIIPQGDYMNRFIGYHLAKTRLTPWLLWKIGANGYLHWGWNYWVNNVDGQWHAADTFDGEQNGDAWLIRPDKDNYDVYDSLRSEAQLDGIEDYELLAMLAREKPLQARSLAASLVTNSVSYVKDGATVTEHHQRILEALESGGADETYPYTDGFDNGEEEWRHTKGTWSVTPEGQYAQTDLTSWEATSTVIRRAYSDVSASVDLRIVDVNTNGGNTNWAGLMVRNLNGTDLDSGYLIALRNNGEVFVYRSGETLGTAQVPGYEPGATTTLRVEAQGEQLAVYAGSGEEPVLTVEDAAYTEGHVAVVTGGASAHFDNVTLEPTT